MTHAAQHRNIGPDIGPGKSLGSGAHEGPRLRATLDEIPLYRAGQRPADRHDLLAFKLSSNENPYPPLPRVRAAIAAASAEINRYPDPASAELVAALAEYHGVAPADIALGTGAVALCYQLAACTVEPGDEILYPWRSFEAYPIVSHVVGATPVAVPLTPGGEHDLDAMAAGVTERTRLIFVCSPNNPTGTVVGKQALNRFLDRVPPDVVVALDEAYIEFNRDPDAADGLADHRHRRNVVILRTFSKAYGLAGLRVGYAIADPLVATALRKTAIPFGISGLAQVAAVESLADDVELLARVEALAIERERVAQQLRRIGWTLPRSQANFLWLPLGERSAEFAAICDQAGLTIRAFPNEGARVTIAETEANDRLIDVCRSFAALR